MPPKRKAAAAAAPAQKETLASLVDSDNDELAPPAAKKRAPAPPRRKPVPQEKEVESAGEEEVIEVKKKPAPAPKPAAKGRGRKAEVVVGEVKTAAASKPRGKKAAPVEEEVEEEEEEEEEEEQPVPAKPARGKKAPPPPGPTPEKKSAPARKRGPAAKKDVREIAETQFDEEVAVTPARGSSGRDRAEEERRFKLEELRELAAEKALEEFKRNSEVQAREADNLIKALEKDLEKQSALADESKALKKQLAAKDSEIAKLKLKIEQLNKNVQGAQKENQVLAAKLTAAKQVTAPMPGSAVKSNAIGRGIIPSSGSTGNQDWMLAAKENLYGDLTNLVIMSVKQEGDGKLFECLQTGTNGTLHFQLQVRDPSAPKKAKAPAAASAADDDDDDSDEYVFIPKLDSKRDQVVISLLPDYLRTEITFSREHAARFYQKIHMVLMKPPASAVEGDTDEDESDEGDDTMTTAIDGETSIADTTMAE